MKRREITGRLELTWMGKDASIIPQEDGQYEYTWVDPDDPRVTEVRSIEVENTVGDDAGDNLVIIGDSGDALRSLAQVPEWADKYLGQVNLCYIDPPFNTGKIFENYADQIEHSVWLTMMRDRLRWVKPLLAPDASIWVHLDDVEVHRMRVLLDEEFGAQNFVAQIAWRATDSSSNNAKSFAKDQNTILVYGAQPGWRPNFLPDPEKQSHYRNPDNDPRGPWYDGRDVQNPKHRENLRYTITAPNGNVIQPPTNGWRWEWPTLKAKMDSGEVYFNEYQTALKRKTYLWESDGLPPSDFWGSIKKTGSSRRAKNHLKKLFPGVPTPSLFDTPKPEELMKYIIELSTDPGGLVLDFFGGSGSTASTAHKTSRRWVTVELLDENADRFLIPRLTQVVDGTDEWGVSVTEERVADADLPEGMTPEEAEKFNQLLRKVLADPRAPVTAAKNGDDAETKARKKLLKSFESSLKGITKTKDAARVNWSGGGGFRVARVGPSMYSVDDELGTVFLSDDATNGAWSKAVAGQLGFRLTEGDPVFVGVQGRQKLAVVDGVVGKDVVEIIAESLGEDELAVVVAKAILPEARSYLHDLSPGSKIRRAPDQIIQRRIAK